MGQEENDIGKEVQIGYNKITIEMEWNGGTLEEGRRVD